MEIQQVNIVDIQPYENNPRKNDKAVDVVAKSIKEFGFLVPVILDDKNILVAGHTRVKAAIKLGMSAVPSIYTENLTQDQIDAFRIMDNKSNEYATWNDKRLYEELKRLQDKVDLDITGFTENELSKLLGNQSEEEPVPEGVKYDIHIEDFYELDNGKGLKHYVYCGDATNKEDVDKLLQGNKVDLLLTDPPYGIDIVNKIGTIGGGGETGFVGHKGLVDARKYKKIEGDDKPFDPRHLLDKAKKIIIFGGNHFSDKLPCNSHWLVWDKKGEGAERINTFSDAELMWTNLPHKRTLIYRHKWSGLLREGNRDEELKTRIHPTQKPVGLLSDILKDYSNNENNILDLYGGSGSTLIACEQTGRNCYMMELDEDYCSKIIERWENLTGKTAKKISGQ